MRNNSIGYYPLTGYAWMTGEDKKIVQQYVHHCSLVPNAWGCNHTWDLFKRDVLEIY